MSGVDYIGTFNNENRNDVQQIKEKASELIDLIFLYGHDSNRNDTAARDIEKGTMMGIKSLFI